MGNDLTQVLLPNVLEIITGLAILMYSIKMVSSGLEALAGNKLKDILQKSTDNRFKGFGVGTLVTALLNSSTATTVMVVGFVNAGLLNLYQALWIIMGANIGTNVTAQLASLSSYTKLIAPFFAIIGAFVVLMTRNKKLKCIGEIVTGLGFIFIGTGLMKSGMDACMKIEDVRTYLDGLFATLNNPILGILVGILFVVITHNSASGIVVLQGLIESGAINLGHATYIIYGLNIGTCITALFISLSASKMAIRAAMMHLMFNVTGTVIFSILNLFLPITGWIEGAFAPESHAAMFHLIFNLGATAFLLPIGGVIVKMVYLILPDKHDDSEGRKYLKYLNESMLSTDFQVGPTAFINAVSSEIGRMLEMATSNVSKSLNSVLDNSEKIQEEINETEEYVDYLNKEISYYISHSLTFDFEEKDALVLSALFKITGNIERMGDHATNIAGYADLLEEKGLKLSSNAQTEVRNMIQITEDSMRILLKEHPNQIHVKMAQMEQKIDDMTDDYREHQLTRMKTGVCSGDACVVYSEMLTDFERLGDHMLNIAEAASETDIRSFGLINEENKKKKEA